MSLLTSRDPHSLDTYQSRDPRIKIAAQRITPLEYMLKVIENILPQLCWLGVDPQSVRPQLRADGDDTYQTSLRPKAAAIRQADETQNVSHGQNTVQ